MTAQAPLPALRHVYEVQADPRWQAIEFISDLHLATSTPRTVDAWVRYMQGTPADAVFILGDLFEVWIGDDARTHGGFAQRAAAVLADAAARCSVSFMAGNRDFLVGSEMLRDCGVAALPDPTVLDAWGQRVLLTHGDALCLADTDYLVFRAQVRSDAWRQAFLAKPLAQREQIARAMRDASEAAKHTKPMENWADVDAAGAVAWLHASGSATMVHGHTHRPGSNAIAPGFTRHVLSDWDADKPPLRAQVLRLTRDGFLRLNLDMA